MPSPAITISLRRDTQDALSYLVTRWHAGSPSKRNAVIQRAILEAAQRELTMELAERNAQ